MGNEKDTITTVRATESSPPPSTTATPPVHRERPTWLKVVLLIIDIGLALSPLLFLGIAFAAIAYNHKRVLDDPTLSKNVTIPGKNYTLELHYVAGGQSVIDVAQIAVSIFPILFAAIVGRFMKAYALRRAERGSTMGVLEQLYGSQNLSNAVQLLFALRGPGLLGIAVVVVWLLSPIGGQGVKRVLGTKDGHLNTTVAVYYCNTSSEHNVLTASGSVPYGVARSAMNDALGSLLFTDSVSGESDVWGNVKIPRLNQAQADSSEWMDVGTDVTYSAMTGLLINNLPNSTVTSFDTFTSFNILTSYVGMTCQDHRIFDYSPPNYTFADFPVNMTGYQEFLDWAGPLRYYTNMTNATRDPDATTDTATVATADTTNTASGQFYDGWQTIFDVKVYNHSLDTVMTWSQPPSFIFATQDVGVNIGGNLSVNRIYAYECASSVQWLEASLRCYSDYSSPCSVMRTRSARRPTSLHQDPIFAVEKGLSSENPVLYNILDFISTHDSLKRSGSDYTGPQTSLNKYLAGAGTYASQSDSPVTWSNVTGDNLSPQLGTLLNSIWLIGVQYLSLVRPKIMNATALQESDPTSPNYFYAQEDPSSFNHIGYDVTAASAIKTTTFTVYQVSWTWVIVAIVISLLLLFLGLVGLYFRHTNNHPDVLGFVSTLTRDNPHFDPPPQAEKLDGMEMASYYKYTRVQLVNTADSDEPTRITLKQVHRSSGDM